MLVSFDRLTLCLSLFCTHGQYFAKPTTCRDGDMCDYHFLITPHPTHKNLDLAIGGSAHGFKFLPVLGKYIVAMMEGTLDPDIASKWKWRPGTKPVDYDTNPHPNVPEDLNDMPGWGPSTKSLL